MLFVPCVQFLPLDEATASRVVIVIVSFSDRWVDRNSFRGHLKNSLKVRDRP